MYGIVLHAHHMNVFLIASAAFFATLIGGFLALRLKDRLHLLLGFSAGAVIAVAFFDLLPEALELAGEAYGASEILLCTVIGFTAYLVLDRFILLHSHHEHEEEEHTSRGTAGAASLSFHSFLDGLGIGLAFHVSPATGIVVAAAVLAHDFSDGVNTVSMILKEKGERSRALRWLLLDAAAPVLGVVATFFFSVSDVMLGLLLALFAGFFIYIGASDLIPESYHAHPKRWTTVSTVLGIVVLYVVIRLAGA
jgi:ZIP family zinc transporter